MDEGVSFLTEHSLFIESGSSLFTLSMFSIIHLVSFAGSDNELPTNFQVLAYLITYSSAVLTYPLKNVLCFLSNGSLIT